MIKYCAECKDIVQVIDESIDGEDYISCPHCGTVIAKLDYNWKLPIDNSDTDSV